MRKFWEWLGFGEKETVEYRRRRPSHSTARDEIIRGNAYNSNYDDYDDDKYERATQIKNGLILFK